jgi:hypothetical protein
MNDIGLTLLAAAARVTLLALAAAPLCVVAARRGPRAGAAVATAGLAGCVALTLLAFCPLPDWWSWCVPPGEPVPPAQASVEDVRPPAAGAMPGPAGTGGGVSLAQAAKSFRDLRRHAEEAVAPSPRPTSRWPAWVAAGVFCGANLGVLRLVLGVWAVAQPPAARAEAAPFDLSALPPDAKGVWAFRPAAFFGQPGMKKYADRADQGLPLLFKEGPHLDLALLPAIGDIEQVVGTVTLGPDPGNTGRSSLMADLRLLRTTRDFDWKKLLAALFPKTEEVRTEHGSYFRVRGPVLGLLGGFRSKEGPVLCYHIADARTVVVGNEADMRRRLSGERAAPPQHAWAAEWKAVEHDLIALAYDGRDKTWLQQRAKPMDAEETALVGIAEKLTAFAYGFSATDGLSATAAVGCATGEEAKQVQRLIAELFKKDGLLRVKMQAAGDQEADDLLIRALLKNDWKVSQPPAGDDCRIVWRCRSAMGLPALIEAMMSGGAGQKSKPEAGDRP